VIARSLLVEQIIAKKNVLCMEDTPFKNIWGNDEELRTITCFNGDPICDHCFDLVQSIMKKEPFRPRYAHNKGYRKNNIPKDTKNRKKLRKSLSVFQKYMDGCKAYAIL
jgi:hypothetical protein